MGTRLSKEEKIRIIMECRNSGLSDYQWCKQNDISPGNFYNWIHRFRESGFEIPESSRKSMATPSVNEVVKVDFVDSINEPIINAKQNTNNLSSFVSESVVAAEVCVGNTVIRLYNDASPSLINALLKSIGGGSNAW